jgi:signal transduction histidine kinase
MSQAFGALMREWLASPPAVLRSWQDRLAAEVGENARLIADVVPELDLVMGKLPSVPEVHGEQVQNRQKLTWLSFVRAVATAGAPLVLFLDDVQWADDATLVILRELLNDVERSDLLVIAAYRDNEAPAEHPLFALADASARSGVPVSRLTVGPLSEEQVTAWLSRALSSEASRVSPLARVLRRRTLGNPFFLEQLLLALHRQGLVCRDPEGGEWRWELAELERASVTDCVVSLLANKVRQMPEEAQQLLGLAACAGHAFQLEDLERLSGWARPRLTGALWPALQEELVVPVSGAYRSAQALGDAGAGALDASFRFLHDRVQQASYERISPEQRSVAHLEIGRRLRELYLRSGGTPQLLLELARHLNLGSGRMASAEERRDLSRLNLDAARAAKAASAHRLMAALLDAAQALLGGGAWPEEPELSVEIALERLQAGFLLREFEDVEARALGLLARPLPVVARLLVQEIRVRGCVATGAFARGRELGLAVLAERGETFPPTEEACLAAYLEEGAELDRWFERSPDAFDRMPLCSSPEQLAKDALAADTTLCAAWTDRPMLTGLLIVRAVSELRRLGAVAPMSPYNIGALAEASSAITGEYRAAARWVEPAARVAERTGSPRLGECLVYRGMYATYSAPAERSRELYEQAIAVGLKSGSLQATSWGLLCELIYCHAWRGLPLGQVAAQCQARWGLVQRACDAFGRHGFELYACWCDLLMDVGGASKLLSNEPLSRSSRTFLADQDGFFAEMARIAEAHLFLVAGAPLRALSRAREAETFRGTIYGCPSVTDVPLWLALAAAKCWDETADAGERERLRVELDHGLARLRYFAEGAPESFLHKQRLLEAERARVEGRTDDALAGYGEAIELAREHGFLHVEALAAQLSAEFHLGAGRRHDAATYLREARDTYARWGALAVVAHLEAKYPSLLEASAWPPLAQRAPPERTATTASTTGDVELDLETAMRAAQALAGELDPTQVVARLMELVLENAGAQSGALVLVRGEALSVAARLSASGARIETGLSEPLAEARAVAVRVVQYAARTQEPVVVGDAPTDQRFRDDRHLQTHEVRSVLAMPLSYQGRLGGVLYLEHASPEAFSPARLSCLSVLTAQGAIALENASLYAERRREEAAARFLAEASRRLVTSLDPGATVRHIAEIPVPALCDACVVCASGEAGELVPAFAVGIPDAAARRLCEALRREPLLAVDEALAGLALSSRAIVPLSTRGRHLGLLCLLAREPGHFDARALALSEELGRRAAIALDNAQLHQASQKALEARDEFLAVASHELRTPLTSMSLHAQHLEQRALCRESGCSEPEARAFATFRRQIGRLTGLVDQMLDFSLIQAGRLDLRREECDLVALVRAAIARLEAPLARSGCAVTLVEDGPVRGRWDRSRIEQVVTTLLCNAVKFGASKPVTVAVERRGAAAELRVEDQGLGIRSDDQQRIFDRFERVAPVRHHDSGLGLGLFLARHIVRAHGGTIQVDSEPGHGARFVVRLPLAAEPERVIPPSRPQG